VAFSRTGIIRGVIVAVLFANRGDAIEVSA
jgi:hypothetical protein